jgi:hypothetical protein
LPLTYSSLRTTRLEKTVTHGQRIVKKILAKNCKYTILVSRGNKPLSKKVSVELGTKKSGFSPGECPLPLKMPIRQHALACRRAKNQVSELLAERLIEEDGKERS